MIKIHEKAGFTLIELLVVVLIIGILSAVALPQYEKAVFKSRVAQAETWVGSARQAAEAAKLANAYSTDTVVSYPAGGSVSGNEDILPMSFPVLKEWACSIYLSSSDYLVECSSTKKAVTISHDSSEGATVCVSFQSGVGYIDDGDVTCKNVGYPTKISSYKWGK